MPNYFYIWWKRACRNLGIEGVDLYSGTRHSSAIALKKYRTPEEIKRATMHSTNKAFKRYFWIETGDLREIYRDTVGRMRGMRVDKWVEGLCGWRASNPGMRGMPEKSGTESCKSMNLSCWGQPDRIKIRLWLVRLFSWALGKEII